MPTRTNRAQQTIFTRPFPAAVVYDLSLSSSSDGTTAIRVPPGSTWSSGAHWHEAHVEFLEVVAGRARVTLGGGGDSRTPGSGGATVTEVGPRDGVVRVPRGVVHEWRRARVGRRKGVSREEEEGAEEREGREAEEGGDDGVRKRRTRRAVEGPKGAQDEGAEDEAEWEAELVVREWTEPRDGAKAVFFRNLNGLILDASRDGPSGSDSDNEGDSGSGSGRGGRWLSLLLTLELWILFWRADNYPVVLLPAWDAWAAGARILATKTLMRAAVALGWVLGCRGVYEEYGP
ncbi:hypothetical protein GGS23DRAFT_411327 [Durotheca rogersii]|uniref:uncharacterized protein n=1 Tax=Durotheca rogersii TaxID=419775 RepID=UPI00221FD2E5|nr:uncharacterized protein GGS23DRAFT_411327 [Durotheca rogersii]KAI5865143.1 hypothetical protein GGS23DRAFT_411327 [Durotheca rogersii]